MYWRTHHNRVFFVADSGRVIVELMKDAVGVTEIIAVGAGSPEFSLRLLPKDRSGLRFIDLQSAQEYIEREWTNDGDFEAKHDEDC